MSSNRPTVELFTARFVLPAAIEAAIHGRKDRSNAVRICRLPLITFRSRASGSAPRSWPRSGCAAAWARHRLWRSRAVDCRRRRAQNSVSSPLDARYEAPMSEKTLPGGNTVGAVRIGDVVHKQASPGTPTVHALL